MSEDQMDRLLAMSIDQHLANLREFALKQDGPFTTKRTFQTTTCASLVLEATGHLALAPGEEDPFFEAIRNEDGGIGYVFEAKMGLVADVIFRLRNEPWYPILRQHWRQQNLADVFWEASVARIFLEHGLLPSFRERKNKRGDDFDFVAEGKGMTFNVEVTKYERAEFEPRALLAKLKKKKAQLPRGVPGIIALSHRREWFQGVRQEDLEAKLDQVAAEFFRNTNRVSAIMWLNEQHEALEDGRGGVAPMHRLVVRNSAMPDVQEALKVFEHQGYATREELLAHAQMLASQSELLQWIDATWAETGRD